MGHRQWETPEASALPENSVAASRTAGIAPVDRVSCVAAVWLLRELLLNRHVLWRMLKTMLHRTTYKLLLHQLILLFTFLDRALMPNRKGRLLQLGSSPRGGTMV